MVLNVEGSERYGSERGRIGALWFWTWKDRNGIVLDVVGSERYSSGRGRIGASGLGDGRLE